MLCQDVMSSDVQSIRQHDTALAAAKLMRHANVGFLVVCDDEGKAVGVVTDRDIVVRLAADDKPMHSRISDVMTHDIVSCRADDDLVIPEELMSVHHTSRVLVLDDGQKPLGVISLSDIARREEGRAVAHTMREVVTREPHHVSRH